MRAGANTVQQTFTLEAASILKHSLSWARSRGHAQLTPLHVASTLLTSKTSALLRRACLKSQPHHTSNPLHCRALELSFNVALNRLPTIPGPLLHSQPSLSNALIAALKRAQAHQRRGFIEQRQQQPFLAVKVELKQLILSILDDPSVSRVLREVGFSSIAVKNNLEDSSVSSLVQCYSTSGGVFSSPREVINPSSFWHTHFLTNRTSEPHPLQFSPQKKLSDSLITDSASVEEDIKLVFEVLLRKKRRNTVIVGDSEIITEGLAEELMSRVERKEVPEELKSVHFVKFQFSSVSLRFMKREEVENNISDLKRKVDSIASGGMGIIIYTGDLKWTLDRTDSEKGGGSSYGEVSVYRPVDHLAAEIGRLLCDYSSSSTNVWLMATASYQTYMKCQMKQPHLEIQWALQAISVPSGGLGLSLHATSVQGSTFSQNPAQMRETKPFINNEEQDKLICCVECNSHYEKEARLFKSSHQRCSLCLSPCNMNELDKGSTPLPYWLQSHSIKEQQKDDLAELRGKWNRVCHSLHQMNSTWKPNQSTRSLPCFRHQESCHNELNFSNGNQKYQLADPSLDSFKNTEAEEVKITLAFGNSLFFNTEKLAALGNEKIVQHGKVLSSQSELIHSIVEALINSRSVKKERWLLIDGNNLVERRRLASAIAESVFGSADFLLFHMDMKNGDYRTISENLLSALRNHEKLVLVLEDVDFADTQLVKFLADGFQTGKLGEIRKEEESSCQTIFILIIEGDPKSNEGDEKNPNSVMQANGTVPNLGTPNLNHKRKAECESSDRAKSPRINEKDEASSITVDYGNSKKEFTSQLSSNTFDLNIRPDQDEEVGTRRQNCRA